MSPDAVSKVYAFQDEEKQQLISLLAEGYLQSKSLAYNRAQQEVGHVVQIRHEWEVKPSDVRSAHTWAEQQTEGIIQTYEAMLKSQIETLPIERGIGDFLVGLKTIAENIKNWIADLLPWKSKQIGGSTWGEGDKDGTEQWIDEASDPDAIDGSTTNVMVRIEPTESSSDFCSTYAGQEYSLDDYKALGVSFPAHVNCVHTAVIVAR